MTDIVLTGLTLVALLGWPLVAVVDVLRRPDRAPTPFQVLAPVQTGLTGSGVPYVVGKAI
jgi:hypothetical protein